MGALLQMLIESQKNDAIKQRAVDFATKNYGADSKEAQYAAAFPEQAAAVFAQQFDPTVQQNQKKSSLAEMILRSRAGGGAGQAPATTSSTPQGSALAQVAQPTTQTAPQMDDAELAAYVAGPEKYAAYLEGEPERKKKIKELTDAQKAERSKLDNAITGLQTMLGSGADQGLVNKTIGQVDPFQVGALGAIRRTLGNPYANDLKSNITTIQSNTGLQQLMDMKASSPSGASGFGSLSGPELALLTSKIRSLDLGQSSGQLKDNLATIDIKGREALQKLMQDRAALDGPRQPTAIQQVAAQQIPPNAPIIVNKTTGQKAYLVNGKPVPIR